MALVIRDDIEQGSEEWRRLHFGVPSASNFKSILATSSEEKKTRTGYLRKLVAQIVTGEDRPDYKSANMLRGNMEEDGLRRAYSLVTDNEVRRIACGIDDELCGGVIASPDGLIGDDGGLELKSMFADLLVGILARETIPPEHVAQVQGNMFVFNRAWWDVCIGASGMPLFIRRVPRDEEYCARLAKEIAAFNAEKEALVAWVRGYSR
jgi:hypothetical protein